MSYCTSCGNAVGPADSFCSTCGKSVNAAPVAPGVPSQPVPQDIIAPAPHPPVTKRRSHVVRNLAWIALAIAAAIAAVFFFSSGPDPKDSLERAGTAFQQHDAQAFDTYVDVQSILNDWTDQATQTWIVQNHASPGQTLAANGIAAGIKALFVPRLAQSLRQNLVSGDLSDPAQSSGTGNSNDYVTGFLVRGIRSVALSKLTYQGVSSQVKSGADVILDTKISSPLSNGPVIVRVRMHQTGDHWRIVAIPDLAGLLAQLHQSP